MKTPDTLNLNLRKYSTGHLLLCSNPDNKPNCIVYLKVNLLLARVVFVILFLTNCYSGHANITIDSVSVTPSSCSNNGTASIYAKSLPDTFLLYALVNGPITAALQNSPLFFSLYPGSYTARLYDINFDSADVQFTISGNYVLPAFSLTKTDATCNGFTDGAIETFPDTNKGLAPYLWEIISPFNSPPQPSTSFLNLISGNYLIRMTDGCGNFQTRAAALSNSGTGLGYQYFGNIPQVTKIGCDTVEVIIYFPMFKEKALSHLSLAVTTSQGITVKDVYAQAVDTINYTPGLYRLIDTVPGVTYSDYLHIELTDTCGFVWQSGLDQVSPFDFELYYYNSQSNCNILFGATVNLKMYPAYPYDYSYMKFPGTLTLVDMATNTLVDSMTCSTYCGLAIQPHPSGNIYQLTITDGCGQIFQEIIQWPSAGVASVNAGLGYGCLDSTAAVYFQCNNFNSVLTVEILSGPPVASSTKNYFGYSDTLIYPHVFTNINPGGMTLKNLPVGTYQYRISDSCGNSITDFFTVYDFSVSNLTYTYSVKKSCLNDNSLYFSLMDGTPMAWAFFLRDATTGAVLLQRIPPNYGIDSIISLYPGKFAVEIHYANYMGSGYFFDGYLTDAHADCWTLLDTITILPYQNNSFITAVTVNCNGTAYVQILVDSAKGVAPYKYEIINGPQVFPQQDSSTFQIQAYGNYVIRIEDACGNSFIQQITIDSASFPPVIKSGILCAGSQVVLSCLSSSYFSYSWQFPNGFSLTGDSLVLNPFSVTDTGLYLITKFVEINGCFDTLNSSIYLSLHDSFPQFYNICSGDTLFVGSHFYTGSGVYRDSLFSISGCDSLVITTLSVIPQKRDTTIYLMCTGDSISINNHLYFTSGTYIDTVTNAYGCQDLVISEVHITVETDSISAVICFGDGFMVGQHNYMLQGNYTDTLISYLGCDSIIVLDLMVLPVKSYVLNLNICQGDSVRIGNHTYIQSGNYSDTLQTSACDSIIYLNLAVWPYIYNFITLSICNNDSVLIAGMYINQPGLYYDTISTLTCDSIVTINLSVNPFKYNQLNRHICSGDSVLVGLNTYHSPGSYFDTIPTSGCDSIVYLKLEIDSLPVIAILADSTVVQPGAVVQLNVLTFQLLLYSWSSIATISNNSIMNPFATINSACWIFVQAKDSNGCTVMDSIFINIAKDSILCDDAFLSVPNVFTPNDDGINDYLKITGKMVVIQKFQVFNRWGKLVFESPDLSRAWDGKYNGTRQPDTYMYIINYEACEDKTMRYKKGIVTLIE